MQTAAGGLGTGKKALCAVETTGITGYSASGAVPLEQSASLKGLFFQKVINHKSLSY